MLHARVGSLGPKEIVSEHSKSSEASLREAKGLVRLDEVLLSLIGSKVEWGEKHIGPVYGTVSGQTGCSEYPR